MAKYISKGSLLGIEGRIQTGSYDDPSGVRRYTTDVVCDSVQFLEPKSAQNNQDFNDSGYYRQDYEQPKTKQQPKQQQRTPEIDVAEDDLPF
jgi:single-strand DNA-binding protein